MHYRNGREAKNGDKVVQLETSSGKILATGQLQNAVAGNDYCNGSIAVIQSTVQGACMVDCLHVDDLARNFALNPANGAVQWLTRYRRYPVFSAPWAQGRVRAFAMVVGIAYAVPAIVLLVASLLGAAVGIALGTLALTVPERLRKLNGLKTVLQLVVASVTVLVFGSRIGMSSVAYSGEP